MKRSKTKNVGVGRAGKPARLFHCFAPVTDTRHKKRMDSFCSALVFFVTLASPKLLAFGKAQINLAFLSFFRNFVRICRISLNKGSLGNWGKTGLPSESSKRIFIFILQAYLLPYRFFTPVACESVLVNGNGRAVVYQWEQFLLNLVFWINGIAEIEHGGDNSIRFLRLACLTNNISDGNSWCEPNTAWPSLHY